MYAATLLHHHELWGQEPADKCCTSELPLLNNNERELYQTLRDNTFYAPNKHAAENLRLTVNKLKPYLKLHYEVLVQAEALDFI